MSAYQALLTAGIILGPILANQALVWSASKRRQSTPSPTDTQPEAGQVNGTPPGGASENIPSLNPPITLPQSSAVPPPSSPPATFPIKLKVILACLIVHEAYIAFEVFFNPPTNVFSALNIPVTTLASQLRGRLLALSESDIIPPHLEHLLLKLQSFDTRTYYVRFGHEAVVSCLHCRTLLDYLLYHTARVSLEYLRTCLLITLMTIPGSGKRKWRRWGLALVLGLFAFEIWEIATMEIVIPRNGKNCEMWHDRIWYMRHALFFLAPLLLYYLPYTFLPTPSHRKLEPVAFVLKMVTDRLHLLGLVQDSVPRNPELRRQMSDYWKTQEEESRWAREDDSVRGEAQRLGMGYVDEQRDEGAPTPWVLQHARRMGDAVTKTLNGFRTRSAA